MRNRSIRNGALIPQGKADNGAATQCLPWTNRVSLLKVSWESGPLACPIR